MNNENNVRVPLVVDLDGTLLKTDLLYESFFSTLSKGTRHFAEVFSAMLRGKAPLKAVLAATGPVDYGVLPYNRIVIDIIHGARDQGRQVYLATASDLCHAKGVVAHLGLFDGFFASDGVANLSGRKKAEKLVEAFGKGGFDYFGNDFPDLVVWSESRMVYVVNAGPELERKIAKLGMSVKHVRTAAQSPMIWLKALRVHQYVKNALVFVPLLTSHSYGLASFLRVELAFGLFSVCASAVYIINDLVDLNADRRHPTKCTRPFASGAIPVNYGMIVAPFLLTFTFGIALATSLQFSFVLVAYFILTLAYSLSIKRKLIADIVVLAMLYTMRVIAGAVILPVPVSKWILAFSMFIFFCLAAVKRYVELAKRADNASPDPINRDYKASDLTMIAAIAAAAGLNAVTVFSLYISSPEITILYQHPGILWLICPILLYWLGRVLVLAHRRIIDEDPIVFALRDRISYLAGALALLLIVLASS